MYQLCMDILLKYILISLLQRKEKNLDYVLEYIYMHTIYINIIIQV